MGRRVIEIDCEEVWRQVSSYLDDDVSTPLRAMMEAHFKNCAHCRAVLDGTRNLVKLMADGRAVEIPPEIGRRFYKKLDDYLRSRRPKKRYH